MTPKTSSALIFPAAVSVAVAIAMLRPALFGSYFGYDLKNLIVPLIQVIMFGMGAKLSVADFVRIFVMPWPVVIGVGLHYLVMPLVGFGIATIFGFPPEIAAGVILVGSVSSGAASNLIAYLSGANVALAVTITACSTIVSPFMTPFLMKTLAGRFVPIDSMKMFVDILKLILAPIILGLIANRLLYGKTPLSNRTVPIAKSIDRALPIVSMTCICVVVAIITSRSRSQLLTVGFALIFAAILHNAIGYLLGYWLARAVRLDVITSRTIAIEVGMQNAGMASALAMTALNSVEAALAPALFGPWMNISGAILAAFWRRKPVPPK